MCFYFIDIEVCSALIELKVQYDLFILNLSVGTGGFNSLGG